MESFLHLIGITFAVVAGTFLFWVGMLPLSGGLSTFSVIWLLVCQALGLHIFLFGKELTISLADNFKRWVNA